MDEAVTGRVSGRRSIPLKRFGRAPGASSRALRLQQQLALFVALPLAILGLLIGLVGGNQLREFVLRLVLERNTAMVQVSSVGVGKELEAYLEPLQVTARLLAQDDASGRPNQVLQDALPYLERFDGGVFDLDANGQSVGATPGHEERLGRDYSFRDYFQAVRGSDRPAFSAVLLEQPSGRPAVVVATPIMKHQQFSGVLAGVMFLDNNPWAEELAPLTANGERQVYMVDASGKVIYRSGRVEQVQWLADEGVKRLVASGHAESALMRASGSGSLMVTSYAPLAGTNWGLVVQEPWDTIMALANSWQWVALALILLAVVVGPVLLLFILGRVIRPIVALAEEAHHVTLGEAFRPLPVPSRSPLEVETLIEVFNQMVMKQEEQQSVVRQYAIQVVQSQEEERKRLARELHDETVQEMVGLVQRIELCRKDIVRDPEAARRRLDELQHLAKQAVADLRRMSNDLRPLLLEAAGLTTAIQTLCDELARCLPTARVHCEIVGDARRLDPEKELTVFRILQEALTNIRKHAGEARHVNVTLYYEDWGLLATVEDDGPGVVVGDVNKLIHEGHLGLAGMLERARLIGGQLDIEPAEPNGTTITLRVPGWASSGK